MLLSLVNSCGLSTFNLTDHTLCCLNLSIHVSIKLPVLSLLSEMCLFLWPNKTMWDFIYSESSRSKLIIHKVLTHSVYSVHALGIIYDEER